MFEFEYRLVGTGWSEARVADDAAHAVVTASYLSDALGNLIEAVALVIEGAPEARCTWDEEPGEYRWVFRQMDEGVDVQILAFPELWGNASDSEGEEVFRTQQAALRLGRVVLAAAQTVLDQHGLDGYKQRWVDHPFPTEAVERLRLAVREHRDA